MKKNSDLFAVIVSFLIMGFLGTIFLYIYTTHADEAFDEWTTFKQEHSCNMISVDNHRAKYGWLCADGVTYYNRYAE